MTILTEPIGPDGVQAAAERCSLVVDEGATIVDIIAACTALSLHAQLEEPPEQELLGLLWDLAEEEEGVTRAARTELAERLTIVIDVEIATWCAEKLSG